MKDNKKVSPLVEELTGVIPQKDIKIFIDGIENPAEPNQALKDAAENHAKIFQFPFDCDPAETFIEGVKWQQERTYSEEEVIAFGEFIFKHSLLTHAKGVKNLFEQFKKK
jgi:hypothetical protein